MKSHRIAFIIAIAAFALLAVFLFPGCAIQIGKNGKYGRVRADLTVHYDAPGEFKEVRE